MGFQGIIRWCALLLLTPAVAMAGGTAHFESEGEAVVVEFDGAGALRIGEVGETGVGETGAYMLMRDGALYSVVNQNGSLMVFEIGGAMAMMGAVGGGALPGQDAEEVVSFRRTGKRETVAGLVGRVHEVTVVDSDGVETTETMVLSKDKSVHELTLTMAQMSEVLMKAMNEEKTADMIMMEKRVLGEGYGVLRYGDGFVLSHIDNNPPAPARFDLPAEPMDMSAAMGGFMQAMEAMQDAQEQQDSQAGQNSQPPGIIEKKAERQSNRAKRKTEKEVDRATDKAVDKVFKKLFGG